MKKILALALMLILLPQNIQAGSTKSKVIPLSKSKFVVLGDDGKEEIVDLSGHNYIVVSLREKGADGGAYAIDHKGVLWLASIISSGAKGYETPSGIFNIHRKERFYMSKQHPEASGINNMDFSLWFTNGGHAIHMGDDNAMSYGCVHMGKKGAKKMFNWAKKDRTKVVVTREHYLPYVYYDLLKAGYKETDKTPEHIKAAIRSMPPAEPDMKDVD